MHLTRKKQINRLLDENKKCPTIKSRKWDVLFGKVTFVCFGAEQFVVLAAVVVVLANRVALARITLKKKKKAIRLSRRSQTVL